MLIFFEDKKCIGKSLVHKTATSCATQNTYLHLFTPIYNYFLLFSSIYTYLHLFTPIYNYFHLFSSIFFYLHLFTPIFNYFHLFSSIFIYFHLFSTIFNKAKACWAGVRSFFQQDTTHAIHIIACSC